MSTLRGKVAFITGASRGIGAAIAHELARKGASVVLAAKSAEKHKILPGTIHSVAEEIREIADRYQNGAKALPLQLDVRDASAVEEAIEESVSNFGHLDIVVNNASAINLSPTTEATPKVYDLVNNINARGTWLVSKFAFPHLIESARASRNPHMVTLSPPLHHGLFDPKVTPPKLFADTRALYCMSKIAMSTAAYAFAAEGAEYGIASNTLWPYTMIGTSAMRIVNPEAGAERTWRSPRIVADAAVRMLEEDAKVFTGRFIIDELYLRQSHKFSNELIAAYSLGGKDTPFKELAEDLYITPEIRKAVQSYYF